MSKFKILLVEDKKDEIEVYESSIRRYKAEYEIDVETCIAQSVSEAYTLLNNSYDGAIIDLKLEKDGDEGNQVIQQIHENFRIPIIVFSGTPDYFNSDKTYILDICKKGEKSYEELISQLYNVYQTGLTKIMSGRGVIEQTMDKIFWNNLHSKIPIWETYVAKGHDTEKALLRYTINHLLELLDNEEDIYYPEEMYLSPPIVEHYQTGTILREKSTRKLYLVLSPACDLVLHSGSCKTDRILLCEINNRNMPFVKSSKKDLAKSDKEAKAIDRLSKLTNNTFTLYYHYLPPVEFFEGGFVNFRHVKSYKMKDLILEFEMEKVQISAQFIKDIIARFSVYYARQGQPDFNREDLYNRLVSL